jgi:hypothetical protein
MELAAEDVDVPAERRLLAPTLLRSQTLSALHESMDRGELSAEVARDRLTRVGAIPIRLLGDAVLRRRSWEIAEQPGWAQTYDAEYVALTHDDPAAASAPRASAPMKTNAAARAFMTSPVPSSDPRCELPC